jgi:hypothetical protein
MGERLKKGFATLAVLLAFIAFCPLVFGQEATPKESTPAREITPKPQGDKWQMEITPYFWAASLTGDVTVKGLDTHMNESFSDLARYIDAGGMLHVEALKGNWGFFMDGMYLKLSDSGSGFSQRAGFVSGDVTIEQWVVELGGLYRIGQWSFGDGKETKLSLDALGGGRYWWVKGTLDFTAPSLAVLADNSGSKEWVDPFVGLRMQAKLTRNLSFHLRGDVGGFGVGSDFSWNAYGLFGYSFTPSINAYLGYRALAVNYESGSGLSKFKYDVTMYGPVMGVGFKF